MLELAGYRFQPLVTNLPTSVEVLNVWRRYNGRADLENRIKELGEQFGSKRWCVLLQRRLGQLEKCELNTLRWRLFGRAAVWSKVRGKLTLKLAVRGEANRNWWREILSKLTAHPTAMQLPHSKPERVKLHHLCVLKRIVPA